jgi:hypothetical protein
MGVPPSSAGAVLVGVPLLVGDAGGVEEVAVVCATGEVGGFDVATVVVPAGVDAGSVPGDSFVVFAPPPQPTQIDRTSIRHDNPAPIL